MSFDENGTSKMRGKQSNESGLVKGPALGPTDFTYTTARKGLQVSSFNVGSFGHTNEKQAASSLLQTIPGMRPTTASSVTNAAWKAYGSPSARGFPRAPAPSSPPHPNSNTAQIFGIMSGRQPHVLKMGGGFRMARPGSAPAQRDDPSDPYHLYGKHANPYAAFGPSSPSQGPQSPARSNASFGGLRKSAEGVRRSGGAGKASSSARPASAMPVMTPHQDHHTANNGEFRFQETMPTDVMGKLIWDEQLRRAKSIMGGANAVPSRPQSGRPASAHAATTAGSSARSRPASATVGSTSGRERFTSNTIHKVGLLGAEFKPPVVSGFAPPEVEVTVPAPDDPRWAFSRLGRTQLDRIRNGLKVPSPPRTRPTTANAFSIGRGRSSGEDEDSDGERRSGGGGFSPKKEKAAMPKERAPVRLGARFGGGDDDDDDDDDDGGAPVLALGRRKAPAFADEAAAPLPPSLSGGMRGPTVVELAEGDEDAAAARSSSAGASGAAPHSPPRSPPDRSRPTSSTHPHPQRPPSTEHSASSAHQARPGSAAAQARPTSGTSLGGLRPSSHASSRSQSSAGGGGKGRIDFRKLLAEEEEEDDEEGSGPNATQYVESGPLQLERVEEDATTAPVALAAAASKPHRYSNVGNEEEDDEDGEGHHAQQQQRHEEEEEEQAVDESGEAGGSHLGRLIDAMEQHGMPQVQPGRAPGGEDDALRALHGSGRPAQSLDEGEGEGDQPLAASSSASAAASQDDEQQPREQQHSPRVEGKGEGEGEEEEGFVVQEDSGNGMEHEDDELGALGGSMQRRAQPDDFDAVALTSMAGGGSSGGGSSRPMSARPTSSRPMSARPQSSTYSPSSSSSRGRAQLSSAGRAGPAVQQPLALSDEGAAEGAGEAEGGVAGVASDATAAADGAVGTMDMIAEQSVEGEHSHAAVEEAA